MINIAELLRNTPKGLKLYSPLFCEVAFGYIGSNDTIWVCLGKTTRMFSSEGRYRCIVENITKETPECLLFPSKDCRTWEGWKLHIEPKFKVGDWVVCWDKTYQILYNKYTYIVREINGLETRYEHSTVDENGHLWTIADAKDGDILHHSCTASNGTFIFKGVNESGKIFCYCDYDSEDHFCLGEYHHIPHSPDSKFVHPATKEQRDLLFAKIKEAGYEWDEKKKELCKIIKPKFKVGDDIKTGNTIDTIAEVDHATRRYYCESGRTIWFKNQDLWHLAPKPHYNISNFRAGMPVLVRADNVCRWNYSVFSNITGNKDWQFAVCNGVSFTQCIPFEGNEHLLGTTDQCDERFINW